MRFEAFAIRDDGEVEHIMNQEQHRIVETALPLSRDYRFHRLVGESRRGVGAVRGAGGSRDGGGMRDAGDDNTIPSGGRAPAARSSGQLQVRYEIR